MREKLGKIEAWLQRDDEALLYTPDEYHCDICCDRTHLRACDSLSVATYQAAVRLMAQLRALDRRSSGRGQRDTNAV